LRYAWVGGSIWGAYVGALAAAVIGCVFIRNRWRRVAAAAAGYEVSLGAGMR
jgi:hypothetical protein